MKSVIRWIVAIMFLAFSVGTMANVATTPGEYVVKRGDTWWKLFGASYTLVQEDVFNHGTGVVRKGNILHPGDVIYLPNGVKVRSVKTPPVANVATKKPMQAKPVKVKSCNPCRLPHFNEDAFRTSGRDRVDAVRWLGFSLPAAEEVTDKYRNGTCEDHTINPGDEFGKMVGRTRDLIGRIIFTGGETETAKRCVASTGQAVIVPDACENWATALEKPVAAPKPPVAVMPPPIQVDVPTYATVVVPDTPKPVPPVVVSAAEPALVIPVEVMTVVSVAEPGRKTCDRGYELSGGAFEWHNFLAEGRGVYAENMCWNSVESDPRLAWGYGLYGLVSPGESRVSTYVWDEKTLAAQLGFQRNFLNDEGFEEQLLGKIRIGREWQKGSNAEGFSFSQRNLKLGTYGEWWKYLNAQGDRIGAQFESWGALDKDAKGGEAQSRTSYQLLGFYDTKLSEDGKWGFRGLAGPAYTKWDKTWWLRVIPEFRYTLDNGALVAFGPYGNAVLSSETYAEGAPNTIGSFVRVELGGKFRKDAETEQQRELCRLYKMQHCPVDVADTNAVEASAAESSATEGWDVFNINRQIESERTVAPAPKQTESVGEGWSFLP